MHWTEAIQKKIRASPKRSLFICLWIFVSLIVLHRFESGFSLWKLILREMKMSVARVSFNFNEMPNINSWEYPVHERKKTDFVSAQRKLHLHWKWWIPSQRQQRERTTTNACSFFLFSSSTAKLVFSLEFGLRIGEWECWTIESFFNFYEHIFLSFAQAIPFVHSFFSSSSCRLQTRASKSSKIAFAFAPQKFIVHISFVTDKIRKHSQLSI